MKNKVVTLSDAVDQIKDGMTLMIGGFMSCGAAETVIDEIVRRGIKNLTVIANDTGLSGPEICTGIAKLIRNKLVSRCFVSHIGLNPEAGAQMIAGEIEMNLIPQGTLIERVRAKGAGLGGFLTPTGVGTEVANGKQVMTIEGKEYLLELPISADIAIVRGAVVDTSGNVVYSGTTRNFNPLIATAADIVIVEAEKIVEVGEIDPNDVVTPGLFVDFIVKEGEM